MDSLSWRDFDPAAFLADYWQRRPLLIRDAFTTWNNPLEPEELAGLACEEAAESRLVVQSPKSGQWKLEKGPIPESRFPKLPKCHWTLLVQAVDQWLPEVAALIEPFRFVPDWRIDDVMVSYAADQGSVGPHFDQYDVFLIQGLGRRRWRLGQPCDRHSPQLPHPQLRLLRDFQCEQEWLLEPGDILYVPPGLAHWGIAEGSGCMTYSVGFRAPSRADLLGHWCDQVLSTLDDDDRYRDGTPKVPANPGEIDTDALQRLQQLAVERLADRDAFARWFGTYATERKYPEQDDRPERPLSPRQLLKRLREGAVLVRNPASRLAFVRTATGVLLFADGESYAAEGRLAPLAERLCAQQRLAGAVDAAAADWLSRLYDEGVLQFDGDDD
jgi:50S ribosomal protein L16 3-hydroxylase